MGKESFFNFKNIKLEECVVSLITGWAVTSIFSGSFKNFFNQEFSATIQPFLFFLSIIIFSIVSLLLYNIKPSFSRIMMFFSVYTYMILCAFFYDGTKLISDVDYSSRLSFSLWQSRGYDIATMTNNLGEVFLSMTLSIFAILAFYYVKEDIFSLFAHLKLKKWQTKTIIIMLGIIGLFTAASTSIFRYLSYYNSTYDFGIFTQMFEYMRQTGSMSSTLERNFQLSHFAVHFSPIFYLILPFYYIAHTPVTLCIVFACMIVAPVLPIYLLCKHYEFQPWPTIGMICLYLLYPVTLCQANYDLHENCFLTFLILMVIWAIEKDNWPLIITFTILTWSVKEDAPFYTLIIGLYFLISKRKIKKGSILCIVSLVYFFAISAIMATGIFGYTYNISNIRFLNLYYNEQNTSLLQIFYSILMNPSYAIGSIPSDGASIPVTLSKIEYICLMLFPIALILLDLRKNYSRLVLMIPFLLFNLLPGYYAMHIISYHYNFGTTALFIYILILNMNDRFTTPNITKGKKYSALVISLICTSIMFMSTSLSRSTTIIRSYSQFHERYHYINQILATIPKDKGIAASPDLTPHLYEALHLYDIKDVYETEYDGYANTSELDSEHVDYIVIFSNDSYHKSVTDLLDSGLYQLDYNDDFLSIYRK